MNEIELIENRVTTLVVNSANLMKLSDDQLAKVLRTSPSTITQLHAGEILLNRESNEWEPATDLIKLYLMLYKIVGGDDQVLHSWLKNHNTALNDAPINLITTGGMKKVVKYLEGYFAGGYL